MTIVPPDPGEPRRPHGPRDPGDAWVVTGDGTRYWGRFGAAGLLAVDPLRGVLLQHRVAWSHFGDTWGLPGGARHQDESACDAALRESAEEAGVPRSAVAPRLISVFDAQVWTYSTLVADVTAPFEAVISDPESRELAWVPVDAVDTYPLHPGFGAAWPKLRALLPERPAIVVDAANVVGAVPDGWWKDRAGAAGRLLDALTELAARGMDAGVLDLPEHTWFPEVHVVLEGEARAAADIAGLSVVRAAGEGDDTIAALASELTSAGRVVTVVTSDRGLSDRTLAAGVAVRPVSWLRALL
ncbi:MAG: NTP pyrophosphohydrolase [Microbacterium sp. SCN 70-200]|uniref:NUDIX domain-containing protein n=1 Tax=unclassified Microbacterium TaxID=2609290 RepID=UPI00086F16F3|nr:MULTISPECIES: NUDIX domain-containing protein [unclassified Microbacterium]MBN9215880.1 NUDIX domain-containing protein [Microbacterium sp.]ODT40213.1 MAG: NTP pyrophosphohydrolase [Microbacterium sp. SCN 70-200]OJV82581.1 MAG: NTP pyrophosphohydrolase [Microbacterium sp. 70-16]